MSKTNGRMTIELDRKPGGKPFLRLRSNGNHAIVLSGETRSTRAGASETALRIVDAGLLGFRFVDLTKVRGRKRPR